MVRRPWFNLRALIASVVAFAAFSGAAYATPVTYIETISSTGGVFAPRDLTRTRTLQDGSIETVTNDATVISENLISNNFGIFTNDVISFQHVFVNDPPAGTFLFGSLTLVAFGVDGGIIGNKNDTVTLEGFPLFNLEIAPFGQSVTTISTTLDAVIKFALADDGVLAVTVTPTNELFNGLQFVSSTMEVRYEPVPEPATMLLLGSGLVGLAARRRRKA